MSQGALGKKAELSKLRAALTRRVSFSTTIWSRSRARIEVGRCWRRCSSCVLAETLRSVAAATAVVERCVDQDVESDALTLELEERCGAGGVLLKLGTGKPSAAITRRIAGLGTLVEVATPPIEECVLKLTETGRLHVNVGVRETELAVSAVAKARGQANVGGVRLVVQTDRKSVV